MGSIAECAELAATRLLFLELGLAILLHSLFNFYIDLSESLNMNIYLLLDQLLCGFLKAAHNYAR